MVTAEGRLRSYHNSQQYCMSVQNNATANGTRFITYGCGTSAHHQFFELAPAPDWPQSQF